MRTDVFDDDGLDGGFPDVPQRTSLLAILSLVCAILCFIPLLSILGIGFGIASIFAIRGSRGRVGGTGIAVSGIVLGSVVTLVQVALVVGLWTGMRQFMAATNKALVVPTQQALSGVDTGDPEKIKMMLQPSVRALVTDADVETFRKAYQTELGSFTSFPTTIAGFWTAYAELAPQFEQLRGRQNAIPIPANFAKGPALLVLQMSQTWDPERDSTVPLTNISIVLPSGQVIDLIPSTLPGAPAPRPLPPSPPPAEEPPPPDGKT